jgi:NADH-quinone oxidoreductase subunit G/NADP-reducing hydrogenase subunit HndD
MKARKINIELLLSNHPDDCLYCERNGSCELQSLAEDLNIRERRISGRKSSSQVDKSSPAIVRDPAKCILCGRCVRICEELMNTSTFGFAHRGNNLRISTTLDKPLSFSNCTSCGQCLIACPTGALIEHIRIPELETHLNDPRKTVVIQYTPAVAVSVAESLGFKPGVDMSGIINSVLKRYGFDYVFETSFGAGVMMMEQAAYFTRNFKGDRNFPFITSSCPAWISYAEHQYPELLPYLSPLKSPQQITGSLVRDWLRKKGMEDKEIVSVLVSSCTAAKAEAHREELKDGDNPVIDLVLTVRELARLIKLSGLDLDQLEPGDPDPPFRAGTTAGSLTAVAGGEAESTMRILYQLSTGENLNPSKLHRFRINKPFREMNVRMGKDEIRMGCVSGLVHASALIDEIMAGKRKLDLLEVMACPDGCSNGGGQPVPVNESTLRTRTRAIYDLDNNGTLQSADLDPGIRKLYHDFLGETSGRLSRELLYTTFSKKEVVP